MGKQLCPTMWNPHVLLIVALVPQVWHCFLNCGTASANNETLAYSSPGVSYGLQAGQPSLFHGHTLCTITISAKFDKMTTP